MEHVVTEQNFDSLLAGDKPVVVDFYATWCGPCKKIAPYVAELAEQYKEQVFIGKCDVDSSSELAARFGIRTIPTLLFFKNGEVVDKHVGAATKGELEEKVKTLL